jgi:NADPH:quinone reductase-like Zn-dependent oxidoreductase
MGTGFTKPKGKRIGLMGEAKASTKELAILAGDLETGKVKSVIDKTYAFSELPEAMAYHEKGHARGKVVVSV